MRKITIVGGGLSGTLLAINLMKKYKNEEKIVLYIVEREFSKLYRGVAYSTTDQSHLLNVRAGGMSLFADDPQHFTQWLNNNGYKYDKSSFVPRSIYAQYIKSEFEKAMEEKSENIIVNVLLDEAVHIHRNTDNTSLIFLKSGTSVSSDVVILALGHISNSEINTLKYSELSRYFRTPWSNNVYRRINQFDDVLLLGSGLTSDDVIISLRKRLHSGKIYSISRNGLQPLVHEEFQPYPDFYEQLTGLDINGIFSVIKKHLKVAENPRAVIDSLRPYTQIIWKNLSTTDKSRFLRHLNKYWNVIRHRVPPEIHKQINAMEESGSLTFLKGNILSITETDRLFVSFFDKNTGNKNEIVVDAIINCIGPESNYKRIDMPLIENLLKSGIIKQNDSGISIKVSDWLIVDKNENVQPNLYAIGPLLKGELFESTAVPELKTQCDQLSTHILYNFNF